MIKLPKTGNTFIISNLARRYVPTFFPVDWIHREETGNDMGIDMYVESFSEGVASNFRIALQIKGTMSPKFIKNNSELSFPLKIITINYALRSKIPFILCIYSIYEKCCYFIDIKNNFLDRKVPENKLTHNINIPINSKLTEESFDEYLVRNGFDKVIAA